MHCFVFSPNSTDKPLLFQIQSASQGIKVLEAVNEEEKATLFRYIEFLRVMPVETNLFPVSVSAEPARVAETPQPVGKESPKFDLE